MFADDLVDLSVHENPEVAKTNLPRELFQLHWLANDQELIAN